jgi:hypothetical protein
MSVIIMTTYNILGEQIAELKGKIMSQKILDAQGPTMETTVSASGRVK